MNYQEFSKLQLVDVLRRAGASAGDYARRSRADLLSQFDALPEEKRIAALGGASLISGAVPAAPVAVTPTVVEESIPDVRVIGTKTLGELFGVRGKHAKVATQVWNDPLAGEIDPGYRFDPEQLSSAVQAINRGRYCWLAGPAGTGKTEFVRNLAAGLGRAFIRVSFDGGMERYEFLGGERVRAGTTVYQRGVILRAYTRPGAIILLDEVSFARPEYLSALHAALEGGVITITETGEVVRRAEGVVFMAADNSNGRGDETGLYVGVRDQNVAFCNRFSKYLQFSYLSPDREAGVIESRTGCTSALATVLVGFLSVLRQAGEAARLDHVPSLREAFYLAEALTDGQDPRTAFEETMVNRASLESREVLQQLWKGNITNQLIADALQGILPVPAQPEQQPEQVAA